MPEFKSVNVLERGCIHRVTENPFKYQGWPSVCRDENDNLYAVASSFRIQHVCPFGKNAMYISRDKGKKWSPPIVVNDSWLDDRDTGIVYMGNGKMLITWFCHPIRNYLSWEESIIKGTPEIGKKVVAAMIDSYQDFPQDVVNGGSFIKISDDYGYTWSQTIKSPVSCPHGPIQLSDHSLLYLGKELFKGDFEAEQILAYRSLDGGYTWNFQGLCNKPEQYSWKNFHEPHVVQRKDGSLLAVIRAQGEGVPYGFTMFSSESYDLGKTWSEWKCLNIAGSPPHLLLHSNGDILLTYSRRHAPFGEYICISHDSGKTWEQEKYIDIQTASDDLGYPASVEMKDGSICTVYYQHYRDSNTGVEDSYPSILYTRWTLD